MGEELTTGVTLMDGEELIDKRHPSWSLWYSHIIGGVVLILIGFLTGAAEGILLFLILGLGLIAYAYYSRQSSEYVVTDHRVIKRIGLLKKQTGETRIEEISSLSTESGFVDRLMGRGNVQIRTKAGKPLGIENIDEYEGLANSIREQQREISA